MAASKNTRRSRTAPGVGDPVMAAAGSRWPAAPSLGELLDAAHRGLSWLVDIKPDRRLRDQGASHHELQPLRQPGPRLRRASAGQGVRWGLAPNSLNPRAQAERCA
jgi:hypothetical protein